MIRIEVIDPGIFSTVQDMGRAGFRKYGVPTSGAMDELSFRLANQLVGNPEDAPVLELTLKGGSYRFRSTALIAVTGAAMKASLNEEVMSHNEAISVKEGDLLELGFSSMGCRGYLAVQGEMLLDRVLGSYATYVTGKFGGYRGRVLQSGDILEWKPVEPVWPEKKNSPVDLHDIHELSIMPGPEWEWLVESSKQQFLKSNFRVSSQSNRMGIRLEGEQIPNPEKEMRSSPVLPGIIQLPPNGQPIMLMKDGQTIGGYPRIAKIADKELWKAGQLKPGDRVRFKWL